MRVNYSRLRFNPVARQSFVILPSAGGIPTWLRALLQRIRLDFAVEQGGVNFSVYSRDAARIDLLLFDSEDAPPSRVIRLDPSVNRTYHYWHIFVPGLKPGQLYGYRAHGPYDPPQGLRFDASKVLSDPYGRGVVAPVVLIAEIPKENCCFT